MSAVVVRQEKLPLVAEKTCAGSRVYGACVLLLYSQRARNDAAAVFRRQKRQTQAANDTDPTDRRRNQRITEVQEIRSPYAHSAAASFTAIPELNRRYQLAESLKSSVQLTDLNRRGLGFRFMRNEGFMFPIEVSVEGCSAAVGGMHAGYDTNNVAELFERVDDMREKLTETEKKAETMENEMAELKKNLESILEEIVQTRAGLNSRVWSDVHNNEAFHSSLNSPTATDKSSGKKTVWDEILAAGRGRSSEDMAVPEIEEEFVELRSIFEEIHAPENLQLSLTELRHSKEGSAKQTGSLKGAAFQSDIDVVIEQIIAAHRDVDATLIKGCLSSEVDKGPVSFSSFEDLYPAVEALHSARGTNAYGAARKLQQPHLIEQTYAAVKCLTSLSSARSMYAEATSPRAAHTEEAPDMTPEGAVFDEELVDRVLQMYPDHFEKCDAVMTAVEILYKMSRASEEDDTASVASASTASVAAHELQIAGSEVKSEKEEVAEIMTASGDPDKSILQEYSATFEGSIDFDATDPEGETASWSAESCLVEGRHWGSDILSPIEEEDVQSTSSSIGGGAEAAPASAWTGQVLMEKECISSQTTTPIVGPANMSEDPVEILGSLERKFSDTETSFSSLSSAQWLQEAASLSQQKDDVTDPITMTAVVLSLESDSDDEDLFCRRGNFPPPFVFHSDEDESQAALSEDGECKGEGVCSGGDCTGIATEATLEADFRLQPKGSCRDLPLKDSVEQGTNRNSEKRRWFSLNILWPSSGLTPKKNRTKVGSFERCKEIQLRSCRR